MIYLFLIAGLLILILAILVLWAKKVSKEDQAIENAILHILKYGDEMTFSAITAELADKHGMKPTIRVIYHKLEAMVETGVLRDSVDDNGLVHYYKLTLG